MKNDHINKLLHYLAFYPYGQKVLKDEIYGRAKRRNVYFPNILRAT